MRLITLCMATLLLLIQFPLWLGKGSWLRVWELDKQVEVAHQKNDELKARNAKLESEVRDLKEGGLDYPEASALRDAPRGLPHVPVRLLAPAAVPDYQHAPCHPIAQAVTSTSSFTPKLSSSSVVWRAMKH